ncbi:hypothetical protein DKP78_21485, partial [Enterococcus faecium]
RPNNCPPAIYEVMLATWDTDPEQRPSFAFLCAYFDDFFANAERSYRPAAAAQFEPGSVPISAGTDSAVSYSPTLVSRHKKVRRQHH